MGVIRTRGIHAGHKYQDGLNHPQSRSDNVNERMQAFDPTHRRAFNDALVAA